MLITVQLTSSRSSEPAANEEERSCISFRIHVQSNVKFTNSAQLAAFYKWMNCVLTDAYYSAERDYVTPDSEFEMPIRNQSECLVCSMKEEEKPAA